MLVIFVSILLVGAVVTLIAFTVLAATSAQSTVRAVAGARAELTPVVAELGGAARQIAERLQRIRPEP